MAPARMMAFPAPSLRELSSECETEGVSSDGSTGPMVTRKPLLLALKFFPVTSIGVHSLSHALWACQLPQRGSRDWCVPFNRVLAKPEGYGRFSSPLRNSDDFGFYHSTNDTPSVTPVGRDSSLREGAGKRSHSTGCSLNRKGTGDFHRPYEGSECFTFHHAFHRGVIRGSGLLRSFFSGRT